MSKKWLRVLLYTTLAVLTSILIFTTDFSEIIKSIRQIKPSLLMLLMAMQLVTEGLLTLQWCQIAKCMGLRADYVPMIEINAKGTVMEAITPGAKVGGEATRAILFKEKFGYSLGESTSLIVIQKIVSISSLVGMVLLALLVSPSDLVMLSKGSTKIVLTSVLIMLLALFFVMFFAADSLAKLVNRIPSKKKWLVSFKNWVEESAQHIRKVRSSGKEIAIQFALSVFIWGLFPIKLVILTRFFGLNGSTVGLVATTLISYLVAMVPLLPGGLGSFEVTMSSILVILGLNKEQSLVVSVSFRFITFWFVVVVSLLIVAIARFIKKERYYEKSKDKLAVRTNTQYADDN